MGEIVKLSELNSDQLNQAVDVFIEGHYNTLKWVTKDKKIMHKLLQNSFDGDMTYAYLHNGDAVGILGLADHRKCPTKLSKETFREVLGGFSGKMAYRSMSAAMEKVKVHSPDEVCIVHIATHPEHRSKGIGNKLIEYVRVNLGYKYVWLEVLSTNQRGIAFYEREGFKPVKVKSNIFVMLQGYGKLITMRMEVSEQ